VKRACVRVQNRFIFHVLTTVALVLLFSSSNYFFTSGSSSVLLMYWVHRKLSLLLSLVSRQSAHFLFNILAKCAISNAANISNLGCSTCAIRDSEAKFDEDAHYKTQACNPC